MEDGDGLRRRREQRRTERREIGAVRHDRRLVQQWHEHVDPAALRTCRGRTRHRRRGQALRLQLGGVGGGQHGRVGVAVRGMDLDRTIAGITSQLIHEEHVLRVRAVEPDAYARDHAGHLSRFAGTAEQAGPGQGRWRVTKPPPVRREIRGGGVGAIIRLRGAARVQRYRVLRNSHRGSCRPGPPCRATGDMCSRVPDHAFAGWVGAGGARA